MAEFLMAYLMGFSPPVKFDLRDVEGKNYVTGVKSQQGGTCWTHATMAAVESNLLVNGNWIGESGEPNLAEYHLDWWNGFNSHNNPDIEPATGGLSVHNGGDYRVAAAYLTRGVGVVRDSDGQSYSSPPALLGGGYHRYFVRDIEWLSEAPSALKRDRIKAAILSGGVVATALTWSNQFYSSSLNAFYQPQTSSEAPNHAVAIVGWDDSKRTQSATPGAWLIKNSWGTGFGNAGYFWISYDDKIAGRDPQMGAVAFKNTEPFKYSTIYSHDTHGWRDTKSAVVSAFNRFVASENEKLTAVSFYTAAVDVNYTIAIYDGFNGAALEIPLLVQEGQIAEAGFHAIELFRSVELSKSNDFYVEVTLSSGGHAFDKTSNVPVLLGGSGRPIVESRAKAGESYYLENGAWRDLTASDATANFCIKAMTVNH